MFLFLTRLLAHLWLARVALIALAVLAVLGLGAGEGGFVALHSALVELEPWIAFYGAVLALLAGAILAHSLLTTWRLSAVRFEIDPLPLPSFGGLGLLPLGAAVTALTTAPLLYRFATSGRGTDQGTLLATVLGALVGTLVIVAVFVIRQQLLARLSVEPPSFLRFLEWFGPGYVSRDAQGRLQICDGHLLATLFLTVSLLVYVIAWWRWRVTEDVYQLAEGSAINYLLGWLVLVTTLLAGLSFLLDRTRFPLLLVVIVGSWLGGVVLLPLGFYRDHTFEVDYAANQERVSLARIAERFSAAADTDSGASDSSAADGEAAVSAVPDRGFVFVSAEGGGIRAAAWTAQVLAGLTEEAAGIAASGPNPFLRGLTMISSTSGGSVGSHFFLEGVRDHFVEPPSRERLEAIRTAATASGLDATAWGLVYPDFVRLFFGWRQDGRRTDRGWALERAWQEQLASFRPAVQPARLSDLARAAADGHGPIVVFNSTVPGSGDPAWISNADYSKIPAVQHPGLYDIDLATAARLSATFPIVSPSPRPPVPGDSRDVYDTHFVDGGYFDNTGDLAILHTLDHFRTAGSLSEGHRVLWIQIRDFLCDSDTADDQDDGPKDAPETGAQVSAQDAARATSLAVRGDDPAGPPVSDGATLGVVDTVLVPLQALFGIRGSSQRVRGNFEAEIFGEFEDPVDVSAPGADGPLAECQGNWCRVRFQPVTPATQCLPLSWALSPENKKAVAEAWQEESVTRARSAVRGFLAGRTPQLAMP
ncbi:MAG: hypothetical protein DWQ36_02975 [Acidobacteria bacterium]|nr:MAG: hypothetical protein DWQ30_02430 [Acidobacteriota bacterium]REK11088.1 MAG: hypothetical protein DWQ36_02975 [Acidobacteriota bacterium]